MKPGEGASDACVYALAFDDTTAHTVLVSQSGFASQTLTGVHGGEDGCVPYSALSTLTVTLEPLDAATDH